MSDADTSEAARALSAVWWGSRVVSRALATVVERASQLDETQWDLITSLADQHQEDGRG